MASLLAILLKRQYRNIHCYAYSPPGGLLWSVEIHIGSLIFSIMYYIDAHVHTCSVHVYVHSHVQCIRICLYMYIHVHCTCSGYRDCYINVCTLYMYMYMYAHVSKCLCSIDCSMTAVPKTRPYITTVVVENDFIPRYMYVHVHVHVSAYTCTCMYIVCTL